MMKILFVCLGNICRSPMAEFVCRDLADKRGLTLHIASAGTSDEEQGHSIHRGTRKKLLEHGVPFTERAAVQLVYEDYDRYNLLIAMEQSNARAMLRLFGSDPRGKIRTLLSYTRRGGDIADPWYTGNFESTWLDVTEGCNRLLDSLFGEG